MRKSWKNWWVLFAAAGMFWTGASVKAEAAVVVAKPATAQVFVDGKEVPISAYLIGDYNYFKLRDLAYVLKDTGKGFDVQWDSEQETIHLNSGQTYTVVGGELSSLSYAGDRGAVSADFPVYINDVLTDFEGYTIGGNTYFKLRDILETFHISVSYDSSANAILLDTSKNYEDTQRPAEELMSENIYEKCSPAVFSIETEDMYGGSLATGSGFLLEETGLAVTNYHVICDAFSAKAVLSDGTVAAIQGVIDYDPQKDIALIQLEGNGFPFLKTGSSESLKGGEKIYTLGSPLGLSDTLTEGIISNPSRMDQDVRLIQISAAISQGSSGGALLNGKGEVIGVTSSGMAEGQNLNFAVPIEYVLALDKDNNVTTFPQVAAAYDQYLYESYENKVQVISKETSQGYLYTGDMVVTSLDTEADVYFASCHTSGTMHIGLYGEEPRAKDLIMGVYRVDADGAATLVGRGVAALEPEQQNGYYILLDVPVEEPGIYQVIVLGMESDKVSYHTQYILSYVFEPSQIEG